MVEEDIPKTAFRCPGSIGLYEWVVMFFSLRNVDATYLHAMNYIFHKLIGIIDVVVKSKGYQEHPEIQNAQGNMASR